LHAGVQQIEKTKKIKTGHEMYAHGIFGGGHNMARSDLRCAENISLSAQDQFEQFIRKHIYTF
jgi:hypothetical protein